MDRPQETLISDALDSEKDPLFELLGRDAARLERVRRQRRRPTNRTSPWRHRAESRA